ncbi:hypothetical protein [Mycobacterium decipiens]|uniref:Helix-turn-helix DNA binding domain protein n=1 Tax=Mycobacterium decipiens TaxID=1430326 RepID=A0A1X2LQP7_9MYCO|nr:hypothetical protein [Mycobacterium decipiens]OSC38747.1 hypothetical protein B8W66_19290 [Mycobacterium decipiens]
MRPLVKRAPDGRWVTVPSTPRYPAPEPAPAAREPRAKLTEDDVRAIRADYAAGRWGVGDLAYIYGVTQSTMSSVVRGHTWRHVATEPRPREKES